MNKTKFQYTMLFHSVINRGVNKPRRNDRGWQYPLSSLLDCYQCSRHDEHISYGNLGVAVPPFGCTFSSAPGQQNILAVANEEGIVRLYNAGARQSHVLKEWLAHENAVFDIAWVPGEANLVTASGDQTARLWDVMTAELLGSFRGHQCSLKSVAFPKQEKAVFCTGGRDGNIMIWDTRCSKKDGFYRQVKQISGAHNKPDRNTPQAKRKRPASRGMAPSVDSQQSVTVVLFRDENTLVSSGAVDGTIKMWDLRKSYTAYHQDPVPLQAYPYPGSSTRKLGYSGLTFDSTDSILFANCTDENIYMFNVSGLKTTPVAVFSGHRNSSFYVKSSVSPDDQFLVSGSSDHHAYIWQISNPARAPMLLQGHSQEVTSVAWCPTDFTKIASCSDDNTIRVWRLDRGVDGAKSSVGEANLVGWACPLSLRGPASHIERTPAKSPKMESHGALSSPQPASCALSGAALPLPSITSAPVPITGSKSSPPPPRTPSSVRQWLSPAPCSPGDRLTPPPCEVPRPRPARTPPAERRAKRRLETADAGCRGNGGGGGGGGGACDCVSELSPDAKRIRGPARPLCARQNAQRAPENEEGATDVRGEAKATASRRADKENSSPGKADWLSAMSHRLRKGHGSPTLPLSPSSSKRPDRRVPAPALGSPQSAKKVSQPTKVMSPQSMKKISTYFQRKTLE